MGKSKQSAPEPLMTDQLGKHDEGPERFDAELLSQPVGVRLRYFEKECTIEHAYLLQACDAVLRAICSPGQGPSLNRLGTMVLVIGPMRVGKTTLINLVEQRLLMRARERMLTDPSHLPCVRVSVTSPGSGRFDWVDYYRAVLRQVHNPFVDRRSPAIRVRDLREAMEEALIQHQPYAVIVDEAHHLAKAASGRGLADQLDHLKYLENRTGVCHVLVGTYEMRSFRKASAQLAGRSIDVHFPRYDVSKQQEREEFRSVLWALQRQLPVEEEPLLAQDCWELLYARSIGCIGLLKLHLIRALALALAEDARTITQAHLRATAPSEDRLQEMMSAAFQGEADLVEPEGADERLLKMLGLIASDGAPAAAESCTSEEAAGVPVPGHLAKRSTPGNRKPDRDRAGAHPAFPTAGAEPDQERAVG
jgi:hypothetical protein